MHKLFLKTMAVTLLLASTAAQAEWKLDGGASSFFYVTNKAAAVTEVNTFTGLSGAIADSGAATLTIDLATVDTAIEIRNQRMRDIVFKVAQFPKAEVGVTVDAAALSALKAGMSITGSYPVTVSLHGVTAELMADMQVSKLDAGTLQVQLARPLVVAASSFGLVEGVEELRTVANLASITPNVVVDFTLVYRQ
ncbi:MAG: YceI family protein [Pseudomonadota bacterium]